MVAFPLNIEIFAGSDETDRPDKSMFQPVQPTGIGRFRRQSETAWGRFERSVTEGGANVMNAFDLLDCHIVSGNRIDNRLDIIADIFKAHGGVGAVSLVVCYWHRTWFPVSDRRPQRSLQGKRREVAIDRVENDGRIEIGALFRVQPFGSLGDEQDVEWQIGDQPGPDPINALRTNTRQVFKTRPAFDQAL